ncbi:hypothetical protein DFS33DRAFT_1388756 [Desarmillaria ectypa]|nr:hypothetical protein DFS33DRAFT_1388756 [Desarmillaria ectypa]
MVLTVLLYEEELQALLQLRQTRRLNPPTPEHELPRELPATWLGEREVLSLVCPWARFTIASSSEGSTNSERPPTAGPSSARAHNAQAVLLQYQMEQPSAAYTAAQEYVQDIQLVLDDLLPAYPGDVLGYSE